MELSYHFLLDLAIILASTKVLGALTKKIHMPQVVGALLAGLILGPTFFNIIEDKDFISQLAEIGVIVLMFRAGLETNISELKKCGKASLVIALAGVVVPLIGGFGIAALFNHGEGFTQMDTKIILQNIFIGVILTATSVSITVETLKELGKLNTKTGTAILGAALIDDVLGIIILTIMTSMNNPSDTSAQIHFVILKIIFFFVIAALVGIPFYYVFDRYSRNQKARRRFSVISLAFCLFMSFVAEQFFGVADITGAFIAGIVLSNTVHSHFITRRVEITSYMLLTPVFFASVGLSVVLPDNMDLSIILISASLIVVAILSKVVGCGLGAMMCKYSKKESLRVGVGMVSRGEVALIVANKGFHVGLLNTLFFAPIIIMVVVTAVITPIFLKIVYRGEDQDIKCVEGPVSIQDSPGHLKEQV